MADVMKLCARSTRPRHRGCPPWIVLEFAPRNARSAARLAPVGIRVSQRDSASAFANCGHTVTYVGGDAPQQCLYSITSSAMASSVGGMLRSSDLAVLILMASSNLVGCMTGRSEGFSPVRTRAA